MFSQIEELKKDLSSRDKSCMTQMFNRHNVFITDSINQFCADFERDGDFKSATYKAFHLGFCPGVYRNQELFLGCPIEEEKRDSCQLLGVLDSLDGIIELLAQAVERILDDKETMEDCLLSVVRLGLTMGWRCSASMEGSCQNI